MSIFRYLKQLVNELPQPADVPSVPASTIVAVNHTVESTLSTKKGVARATIAIYLLEQVEHWQVHCSLMMYMQSVKLQPNYI